MKAMYPEKLFPVKKEEHSYAGVQFLCLVAGLSLVLLLVGPLILRALDMNGDNLPDDWEASYGITTNAYASTNLVGWWQMESNSTNAILDNSTNHLNGTLTNFPTSPFVTGLFSNALAFPTNGQVSFPTNAALNTTTNQFTFSAWFQSTNNVSQAATIVDWSDALGKGWSVGVTTNGIANVTFYDGTTAQVVTGTNSPINLYDGSWHQVAATYATNQVATVYVDGAGEATNTITGYAPGSVSSFSMGVPDANATNNPYVLDEVRLYNRALGAQEIPQLPVTYSDLNGAGLTVFEDYVEGLNPFATNSIVTSGFLSSGLTSYYSGAPTMTKTGGDGQSMAASTFATNPLVVQVKNSSGTPLAGAPVTFSIPSGSSGGVALTSGGTITTSLSMTTDASGYATVYYESGPEALQNNSIQTTAISSVGSVSVAFTVHCGAQSGLALWLKADTGITQSSGNVTSWADQSPTGSYTVTQGVSRNEPTYVANDLDGKPALKFNGSQWLYNSATLNGVNSDMTIITVGMTTSPATYAFSLWLGNASGPNRGVGYYPSYEFFDTTGSSCAGGASPSAGTFVTEIATLDSALTGVTFYRNGQQTATGTLSGVGNLTAGISVGAWDGQANYGWQGDIAEVLVYNHKLTTIEIQQVDGYLADKYGIDDTNATWPLAYSSPVQAEIARHHWNKTQADNYVALQANNPTMLTSGLTVWLKADAGITPDGSGNVSAWNDQTGNYSVAQPTSANRPMYVANDLNGKPGLRFSGNQWMTNAGELGTGLNADMTMITVAMTSGASQEYSFWLGDGLLHEGSRAIGYGGGDEIMDTYYGGLAGISEPGSGTFVAEVAMLNSTLDNITLYRNGIQTESGTISGVQNLTPGITVGGITSFGNYAVWQGDIAEILIYDHQLTSTELQQVSVYLASKYGIPYGYAAPVISPSGGSYTGSQAVTITGPSSPAIIKYTIDGTQPTINSATYTGSFTLSNSALVQATVFLSGQASSPVASGQFYVNDTGSTGLPPTPSSLSAVLSSSNQRVNLSWSLSSQKTYSQVYVYRSTNGGGYELIAVLGSSATSYTDSNIVAGDSYTYEVGTFNQSGISTTAASTGVTPSSSGTMTISVSTPSGVIPQ